MAQSEAPMRLHSFNKYLGFFVCCCLFSFSCSNCVSMCVYVCTYLCVTMDCRFLYSQCYDKYTCFFPLISSVTISQYLIHMLALVRFHCHYLLDLALLPGNSIYETVIVRKNCNCSWMNHCADLQWYHVTNTLHACILKL